MTAIATLVAALVVGLGSAAAAGEGTARHLTGDDDIDVALGWSQHLHAAGGAPEALLGRDDVFADSLASGGLQGPGVRPLLLTGSDELDERVADELERLGTTTVHILGGVAAIGPAVVESLEDRGMAVRRHAGETRIETAVAIAEEVGATGRTAILARALPAPQGNATQAFADSLAAGGWAAEHQWPILLTATHTLSDATAAHLETAAYERVIIVGGSAAVSPEVERQVADLVPQVERVFGQNRFDTAVEIARARDAALVDPPGEVILTDGSGSDAWVDGFAAAGTSGLFSAPIVLSNSSPEDLLPPETDAWLSDVEATGEPVDLTCGASTGAGACDQAAETLGLEPPPRSSPDVVTVDVLVLGGLHYPKEQFFLESAHIPYCDASHYHSNGTVYPVERDGTTLTNPPDCGFGKFGEVAERTIEVSRDDWEAYRTRTD